MLNLFKGITILCFLISLPNSAFGQIAKEVILGKIEKKTINLQRSFKLFSFENVPTEHLGRLEGSFKMANPRFKGDFLYYIYTMDDSHTYKVIYDHDTDKCIYEVSPRDRDKHIRGCWNETMACTSKLPKDAPQADFLKCRERSSSCQQMPKPSEVKIEEIDKKHCKNAYGVEL